MLPNGHLAEITGHQPHCYRYDSAGQLHTVTYPDANPEQHHAEKVELFGYDQTGNKRTETQALAPAPFHANIAKGNRLTFFSDKHFEYDRFGNLIVEKRGKDHRLVTHYEYDCRHRLIKAIKPTGRIITYTYDAFNRRTSKTVDGKTIEFIWQGSRLIAETDNDKHWQTYLYEPDSYRPLALVHSNAQQDNIKLYWYQNDHLGTPIALTSNMGDTLYECQYNAYGQIINETYHQDDFHALPDNPLRFQGQYYDEETGLHYNLNRYYDPFTGRYITQDPLGILGGLNSYQYAGSDPINWIDPLGLIKVENSGFEGVAGKERIGIPTTTAKDPLSPVQQYDAYGNEIVYRTMSEEQYQLFRETGKMPPTTETSISPVLGYSSKYNGVTVKIVVKQGTFSKLQEIGIAANSAAAKVFPTMSIKTGKWMKTNTRFKVEGGQMTTQLGQGRGIEIFNENIVHFEKVK